MKLGGAAKHFILAFLLALAGYAIVYRVIEGRRTEKGPWQVTFTQPAEGPPQIFINQANLAITNVQIVFTEGPSNIAPGLNVSLLFDQPRSVPFEVPFGRCTLMDLRFLPGALTFQIFGHEIQLVPGALIVDRQDHPWQKDMVLTLHWREDQPEPGSPPEQAPR